MMLDLDDNRFKELSYRIANLSCVCNDNKFSSNFKHQFSQPSSVTSSPASSQYSSPINSPPLSPSSVSSYSSAEEDFPEDFSDDFKFDFKFDYSDSANDNLEDTNSTLANLLTIDHRDLECNQQENTIGCDQYDQFKNEYNQYDNQEFDKDTESTSDLSNNQLDNKLNSDLSSQLDTQLNSQLTKSDQVRVRKTSILRNQRPAELIDCESKKDGKKAVKFADTLGYQLEKVKYYPVSSGQPSYNQVNLADLYCDYLDDYDHEENLFFLQNRKPVKSNLKSKNLKSNLSKQSSSKRTCSLSQSQQSTRSPNFWSNCRSSNFHQPFSHASSNYLPFSPIKDQYCDMFYQPNSTSTFNHKDSNLNAIKSNAESRPLYLNDNAKKLDLIDNYSQIYKLSKIEFDGLNFMNNQDFYLANQHQQTGQQTFSILPLNFGQSYIHSDFPNRLRQQSVLLHSINITNNFINGLVSVMNLTFEKKIIIKYTLDKWLTERECVAKYSSKDHDNSDKFSFQICLKASDFPPFKSNEDHILMFAARYETSDNRIFWDNNYGQDYRLKCKFT